MRSFAFLILLGLSACGRTQVGSELEAITSGSSSSTSSSSSSSSLPPPVTQSVIPVLIVAADYVDDATGIAWAAANLKSVNNYTRDWYKNKAAKTYQVDPVVVIPSTRSAASWIQLSFDSTIDIHRFDYFYAANSEVISLVDSVNHRYAVTVYAGDRPDAWYGAAAAGVVSVNAPSVASVNCVKFTSNNIPAVTSACAGAVYGTGHELGHTFGLAHSCDIYPEDSSCWNSVMQQGKAPNMLLLPGEVAKVLQSSFFH